MLSLVSLQVVFPSEFFNANQFGHLVGCDDHNIIANSIYDLKLRMLLFYQKLKVSMGKSTILKQNTHLTRLILKALLLRILRL